jgi:Transmembrane amino acid transporter protein
VGRLCVDCVSLYIPSLPFPIIIYSSSSFFSTVTAVLYRTVPQAPRYYTELEPKKSDKSHFLKMAFTSYTSAALIYIGTVALGLTLFGPGSASFALNSFSSKDPLGTLARFAFGTSVLASFPLIFLSMRNWFVTQAVMNIPQVGGIRRISTLLLMLISFLASKFKDIGVVGSVAGGVLGSSMMFVFPPIMYIRALQQQAKKEGVPAPKAVIALNSILMVLGATLGIVGTTASILASKR